MWEMSCNVEFPRYASLTHRRDTNTRVALEDTQEFFSGFSKEEREELISIFRGHRHTSQVPSLTRWAKPVLKNSPSKFAGGEERKVGWCDMPNIREEQIRLLELRKQKNSLEK